MAKLKLRLKILLQAMYVAWVLDPIYREKHRSIYSRRQKNEMFAEGVERLNQLKVELAQLINQK